jgi:hypothetical protein
VIIYYERTIPETNPSENGKSLKILGIVTDFRVRGQYDGLVHLEGILSG